MFLKNLINHSIQKNRPIEIELTPEELGEHDNSDNVEMQPGEIWLIKHLIKKYNPKKIVEVGVSAGGNTVNLLHWKNKDAQLYSVDIAKQWYKDNSKLSGFMADELVDDKFKDNWTIYGGYDYLDVYEKIGNDIDFIIIDTVHTMPGEFFTFIASLPQLKNGCIVVLHDIHLNLFKFNDNKYGKNNAAQYCTGLLFGSVRSNQKWILKTDIPNIGAFVVDNSTRDYIKDVFHTLCVSWANFPLNLNLKKYCKYINKNYSSDCYRLFATCLKLQSEYITHEQKQNARIDIKNTNGNIEILDKLNSVKVDFPNWFKTGNNKGAVILTNENSFDLRLKCISDGLLTISLKGPDVKDINSKRIPGYVKYNSFKVDNEEILKDSVTVWHDDPYKFEKNVKDGEIIGLHFEFEIL